jgi:hypothetical protein
MQGEGGEGVGCTHACAAERQPNHGRRCCRVGRGSESQQQPAAALACKAFVFDIDLFTAGAMQGEGGEGVHVVIIFLTCLQSSQSCGPFNSLGSCSLLRGCKNLSALIFDCSDPRRCVASDSWGDLPVPPSELLLKPAGLFAFMKAVLNGSSFGPFTSRSCRVMVVGPQMVR